MKKIYCLLLSALLLGACHFKTEHPVQDAQLLLPDGYRVYKGTLPCADCGGIEARLTLNEGRVYVYETLYRDSEDGSFRSTGKYTVAGNIVTIQEQGMPLHFRIEEGTLTLLDSELKAATGVLAPYYRLQKEEAFHFAGRYETFSEAKEGDRKTLSVVPRKEGYQVDFSASTREGGKRCRFSGKALLEKNRLRVYGDDGDNGDVLMEIRPSHDNLGVHVSSPDSTEPSRLYCSDGDSLAGDYIKNTITKEGIGVFATSSTIEDVLHALPWAQVQKKVGRGEFKDDFYDDYEIYGRDGQHLFTVTPKETGGLRRKIERVLMTTPFFRTEKGINRNSTFGEIQKACTITRIETDTEHIVLVVDEINARFTLPKKVLHKGWWDNATKTVNPAKIPQNARVDSFILWWND